MDGSDCQPKYLWSFIPVAIVRRCKVAAASAQPSRAGLVVPRQA